MEDDWIKEKNKIKYNKHRKRQNNLVVAAMYAMYREGKSLEEIGKTYQKSRQAVYDVFRSRGYELRSKQKKGLIVFGGHEFTQTKGGYLRGLIGKRRMLLHWYVWEQANGPVPEGFVIHHKDNDPKNNALENLELIARNQMSSVFNPFHHNQFTPQEKLSTRSHLRLSVR